MLEARGTGTNRYRSGVAISDKQLVLDTLRREPTYTTVSMELIVTIVSKLGEITCLGDDGHPSIPCQTEPFLKMMSFQQINLAYYAMIGLCL